MDYRITGAQKRKRVTNSILFVQPNTCAMSNDQTKLTSQPIQLVDSCTDSKHMQSAKMSEGGAVHTRLASSRFLLQFAFLFQHINSHLFTRQSHGSVYSIRANPHIRDVACPCVFAVYIIERVSCAACNLYSHMHSQHNGRTNSDGTWYWFFDSFILFLFVVGFCKYMSDLAFLVSVLCTLPGSRCCRCYACVFVLCAVYCFAVCFVSRMYRRMKVYLVPIFITQSSCSLTFALRGQL